MLQPLHIVILHCVMLQPLHSSKCKHSVDLHPLHRLKLHPLPVKLFTSNKYCISANL